MFFRPHSYQAHKECIINPGRKFYLCPFFLYLNLAKYSLDIALTQEIEMRKKKKILPFGNISQVGIVTPAVSLSLSETFGLCPNEVAEGALSLPSLHGTKHTTCLGFASCPQMRSKDDVLQRGNHIHSQVLLNCI